jgi:hypothetical protein
MIALLLTGMLNAAVASQLLPDGFLRAPNGIGATLDVGLSQWGGGSGRLNELGIRGGFVYSPTLVAGTSLDVDASPSADSTVQSLSRLAFFLHHSLAADTSGPLPVASVSLAWWDRNAHFDNYPEALDQASSGVELAVGLGLGGLSAGPLQAAVGVLGGGRFPVVGSSQEVNPFLGTEAALMWDLKRIWPGAREICHGLGIYVHVPFQWNFSPLNLAAGTGRASLAARWTLGIQGGLTGSM